MGCGDLRLKSCLPLTPFSRNLRSSLQTDSEESKFKVTLTLRTDLHHGGACFTLVDEPALLYDRERPNDTSLRSEDSDSTHRSLLLMNDKYFNTESSSASTSTSERSPVVSDEVFSTSSDEETTPCTESLLKESDSSSAETELASSQSDGETNSCDGDRMLGGARQPAARREVLTNGLLAHRMNMPTLNLIEDDLLPSGLHHDLGAYSPGPGNEASATHQDQNGLVFHRCIWNCLLLLESLQVPLCS